MGGTKFLRRMVRTPENKATLQPLALSIISSFCEDPATAQLFAPELPLWVTLVRQSCAAALLDGGASQIGYQVGQRHLRGPGVDRTAYRVGVNSD